MPETPETATEPMPLEDVPDELYRLFDEGSLNAAHAVMGTSPIASEIAYIRGGLAAVIPVVRAAERAKVAEEITAAADDLELNADAIRHFAQLAVLRRAARIARGEQP